MSGQVDIRRLGNLKLQIEQIKEQRQKTKSEMDELEQHAVRVLLHMGVRFVDVSNNGQGPFWVLGKDKSDGSFNRQRYYEFFSHLINEFQKAPHEINPEKCTEKAINYLKQFEKRRLVLNKLSRPGPKGVEDLKRWLETGV